MDQRSSLLCDQLLCVISIAERLYFRNLVRNKVTFFSYLLLLVYFGLGKQQSCFYINRRLLTKLFCLGPWYVGELLTDVHGFVCVHGVYLLGRFIPGSLTYLHGTVKVRILVHISDYWRKSTLAHPFVLGYVFPRSFVVISEQFTIS